MGSEMCIRDRSIAGPGNQASGALCHPPMPKRFEHFSIASMYMYMSKRLISAKTCSMRIDQLSHKDTCTFFQVGSN